jgi:hypothetical protein
MEWIIVGAIVGYVLFLSIKLYARQRMLDDVRADYIQKHTPLDVNLERHGEIVYAFTVEHDKFVGQGRTKEELQASILMNVKDKDISVKIKELQKVGFHEQA